MEPHDDDTSLMSMDDTSLARKTIYLVIFTSQVVYARELASRLEQAGVPLLVQSVHPGLTANGMAR